MQGNLGARSSGRRQWGTAIQNAVYEALSIGDGSYSNSGAPRLRQSSAKTRASKRDPVQFDRITL